MKEKASEPKLRFNPGSPSLTVNVCPAMVSVPERDAPVVFAAALKFTVPLPVPLAPD